jgi:hypothetical protein
MVENGETSGKEMILRMEIYFKNVEILANLINPSYANYKMFSYNFVKIFKFLRILYRAKEYVLAHLSASTPPGTLKASTLHLLECTEDQF